MSKKKVFAIALMVAFLSMAHGQAKSGNRQPKLFDLELKAGLTLPLDCNADTDNKLGPALAIEPRWRLRRIPVDIGAELYVGSAVRRLQPWHRELSNRTFSLSIVSDYNFCHTTAFSPFAGLGIGRANCEQIVGAYGTEASVLDVTPRAGFTAWRHLRLTLAAHLSRRNYSHAALTLGYVF